jgi:hypothetical protein
LVEGGRGVFDVFAPNGSLIFSKHAQGRFPETSEIFASLEN